MKCFFRLLRYECRKAYRSPALWIFLAALLILNGWKLHDEYEGAVYRWRDYRPQYEESYAQYVGPITAEKVGKLMTIYRPLEIKSELNELSREYDPNAYTYSEAIDEDFFRSLFVAEMRYDYYYRNVSQEISNRAARLAWTYSQLGNNYEAQKNVRIAADFAGRMIPDFADTRGYAVLLDYDFSSMLILLLCIFAMTSIFVREQDTEMYMLLRTTKNGSGMTVAAKLATAFLFAVLVCAAFYAEDFLSIYLVSDRNTALSSPIYALPTMERTPLRMSIGMYILCSAGIRTLGVLVFCGMLLLLSCLIRQYLGTMLSGLALLLGCSVLQDRAGVLALLRWFNPLELVISRDLMYDDRFVNLFGYPVRLYLFVFAGLGLVLLLLLFGILLCNRSYHNRLNRRRKSC